MVILGKYMGKQGPSPAHTGDNPGIPAPYPSVFMGTPCDSQESGGLGQGKGKHFEYPDNLDTRSCPKDEKAEATLVKHDNNNIVNRKDYLGCISKH